MSLLQPPRPPCPKVIIVWWFYLAQPLFTHGVNWLVYMVFWTSTNHGIESESDCLSLFGLLCLTRWLINNKFIPQSLGDGKCKIKVLANLVSGENF